MRTAVSRAGLLRHRRGFLSAGAPGDGCGDGSGIRRARARGGSRRRCHKAVENARGRRAFSQFHTLSPGGARFPQKARYTWRPAVDSSGRMPTFTTTRRRPRCPKAAARFSTGTRIQGIRDRAAGVHNLLDGNLRLRPGERLHMDHSRIPPARRARARNRKRRTSSATPAKRPRLMTTGPFPWRCAPDRWRCSPRCCCIAAAPIPPGTDRGGPTCPSTTFPT